MDTFETGLSDFYKLTFTVLKQHFPKQKPKVVIHRQYKNFRNDYFSIKLEIALLKYDFNNIDYDNFVKIFLIVLDKHAPIMKKYLRVNYANFMTKQLTLSLPPLITYGVIDSRCILNFRILLSENVDFFHTIFTWKHAISFTIMLAGAVFLCVFDFAKLQFFIAQSIFWIFKIIPGLNVLLIELLSSRNKSVKNTVASLGIIS